MLRKHLPKLIGIALLILTCLIFTVPELMLRAAVFCAAPSYAFSVEFEEAKEIEVLDQVEIGRTYKDLQDHQKCSARRQFRRQSGQLGAP